MTGNGNADKSAGAVASQRRSDHDYSRSGLWPARETE